MNKQVLVEVLTASGCARCQRAKEITKAVIAEYPEANIHYYEINVVESIDYAVELGVVSTPAIALNGKLVFTSTPSIKQLCQAIREHLAGAD